MRSTSASCALMREPLGFSVTVAANGAEAVEVAGAAVFDVILMDMQMPVMGGVGATARIRAEARAQRGARRSWR